MAPHWPAEVDVFSEPHSRMKKLVHKYSKMVSVTDFSDELHMKNLLQNLMNVFYEFKAHEHIENILIMRNLKRKLKAACVTSAAVCNCHSDNRLTDMLEMVVHGLRSQWTDKSVKERQSYGYNLQKALEDFTQNFIPHMEEEEEVFQPMLMQYFSYEELKELKARVIHEHHISSQQEKFVEDFCQSEETPIDEQKICHFDLLPDEICQKIFSYLNPQNLGRAAQTCEKWNRLSKDPALWKGIYPVHWAAGNWTFFPEPLGGVDGPGECDLWSMVEMDPVMCYDEDADVDESSDSDDTKDNYDEDSIKILKETKLMSTLVKYLLPLVGSGVKVVDLAYSRGLSSSLVRKILKLCPNVEVLDLTHTQVGDAAFYEYGVSSRQSNLRHLDMTNCHNITDETLFSLVGLSFKGNGQEIVEAEMVKSIKTQSQQEKEVEIENAVVHCHKQQTSCCKGKLQPHSIASNADSLYGGGKTASVGGCCGKNGNKVALSFDKKCRQVPSKGQEAVTTHCEISDIADKENSSDDFTNSDWCSYDRSQLTELPEKINAASSIPSIGSIPTDNVCDFERDIHLLSSYEDKKHCQSSPLYFMSTCNFQSKPECCSASSSSIYSSPSNLCDNLIKNFENTTNKTCNDKSISFKDTVNGFHMASSQHTCCSIDKVSCSTIYGKGHQKDAVDDVAAVKALTHLEFLSLNGCHLISDQGLKALSCGGGCPKLSHLDLSGCMSVVGEGIGSLVSTCGSEFDHAQLFYCDNTLSDPYPATASGCRNRGCGTRLCCQAD